MIYMLVCAAVFGLLWFLIKYFEKKFPYEGVLMFTRFAEIVLVVLAVLVLICLLISIVEPGIFRWGPRS